MNIKEIIRSWSDERWAIGFVRNSLAGIIEGEPVEVDWVHDTVRTRWFADPFIYDADEQRIILLVEEVNKLYRQGKVGRISRLTIDRNALRILDVTPILELDTHLSFPIIYRKGTDVFICPENSASGCLTLYQYDDTHSKCNYVDVICDDPVTDAVITDFFGQSMLFATKPPHANGNELLIYSKQNEIDRFVLEDTFSFTENTARMAGCFFKYNNCIYRPTQECNVQYGHAITIQEVTHNKNDWQFREVRRIYSTHPYLNEGTHTFNLYKDLIVIDTLGFDRMWIRKCLKRLRLLP